MTDTAAILNFYDNGLNIGQIATRLNIPVNAVVSVVHHSDNRGGARLTPLSAEYLWLARIYWRSGCDTMRISEKLKVPEASVANSLAHWREKEYQRKARAA